MTKLATSSSIATTTSTMDLQSLLARRLAIWDSVDKAYSVGKVTTAIELMSYVTNVLDPKIRKGYGL